ncbi:MAG: biotin--[acetyl-CoA-carboxylase] ligase, partial [Calditrichaeota bacterium]
MRDKDHYAMELGAIHQFLATPERFQIRLIDKLPSTNLYLYEKGKKLPEWTVVVAEEQTRGKGRQNRNWYSPPGVGLWFSILLRPKLKVSQIGLLNLWIAYSVAQYIESVVQFETGKTFQCGLKWPNDIWVDNRKLCGILLESSFSNNQLQYIVAGIGLNINQTQDDFPAELQNTATSLRIETGIKWNREKLLAGILNFISERYQEIIPHRLHDIVDWYMEKALFVGK